MTASLMAGSSLFVCRGLLAVTPVTVFLSLHHITLHMSPLLCVASAMQEICSFVKGSWEALNTLNGHPAPCPFNVFMASQLPFTKEQISCIAKVGNCLLFVKSPCSSRLLNACKKVIVFWLAVHKVHGSAWPICSLHCRWATRERPTSRQRPGARCTPSS